jgi:tetratricopeptide (TPR) repeat protein
LIYFSRELAKKVTAKFYDSLAEGGLLVVSPVETTLDIYDQFIRSSYQGRSFYLKESGSSQALIYNGYEFELPGHDIESKKENLPDTSKPEGESEYERIVFLFEEGLYLRVENLIKQISAVDKLPLEYQLLLGHTYIRLGKHKEAEELLEEIVQKKPEIMRAHYLLGKLYKQTHERKKSVSSFKEAEKLLKRQGDTVEQAKNPVDLRSIGQEIQKELKDQEEIYG